MYLEIIKIFKIIFFSHSVFQNIFAIWICNLASIHIGVVKFYSLTFVNKCSTDIRERNHVPNNHIPTNKYTYRYLGITYIHLLYFRTRRSKKPNSSEYLVFSLYPNTFYPYISTCVIITIIINRIRYLNRVILQPFPCTFINTISIKYPSKCIVITLFPKIGYYSRFYISIITTRHTSFYI